MTNSGDWTDTNTHDPGITVVQVVAYTIAATGAAVLVRWLIHRRC